MFNSHAHGQRDPRRRRMATSTLRPRQIWAPVPTPTTAGGPYCTSFQLPSNGLLVLNASATITLQQDALFAPDCSDNSADVNNSTIPITDTLRPFYSSTTPQVFVLGAMLVVAWSLVIILFITPARFDGHRTHLLGGRRNGAILGNGGRPWLQKAATLFVAISICIATVNTFKVLENQYEDGYVDATSATIQVAGSLELRIFRVLSTTFVLLAQIQTLIRLFPRHREKLIIQWVGIGLVLIDTLFALLNNFYYESTNSAIHPRRATEALPALSYLFALALSLLYAAWVIYYALKKRRFAFFHARMHNISIVAVISLTAVLIPIGFFILDISNPEFVGWGSYVQWVGEAAASVVVWEWVERIEIMEGEENREGILGREIFDGDDMLNGRSSGRGTPKPRRPKPQSPPSGGSADGPRPPTSVHKAFMDRSRRARVAPKAASPKPGSQGASSTSAEPSDTMPHMGDSHSPSAVARSPVSRSDDTSAASTVYAIRHHHVSPSITPERSVQQATAAATRDSPEGNISSSKTPSPENGEITPSSSPVNQDPSTRRTSLVFRNTPNPFKRLRPSPPEPDATASDRNHLSPFSATAKSKLTTVSSRFKRSPRRSSADLPVIVVPAQANGQVWRPPEDERGSRLGADSTATHIPPSSTELQDLSSSSPHQQPRGLSNQVGTAAGASGSSALNHSDSMPLHDAQNSNEPHNNARHDSSSTILPPAPTAEISTLPYLPTVHESEETSAGLDGDERDQGGQGPVECGRDGSHLAPD